MAQAIVEGSVEGGAKLNKYLRSLALRLGQGGEAVVGFLEGAKYPVEDGGLPVAQVAFWNEYGTKFAPSRPFFRNMIEDQSPTWARKLGVAVRYANYNAKQALEILAADINGHLRESIQLLVDPPNAPYTIEKKKGASKPLIDTGTMWRRTGWKVIMGAPKK